MSVIKVVVFFKLFAIVSFMSFAEAQSANDNNINNDNSNPEWGIVFGTCGILPNDTDLRDIFSSYFGIYGEAQKQVKNDFFLGVNATYGFGRYSYEDYLSKARQVELSAFIIYKTGRFEIGAGPVLTNLKLIETYNSNRNDFSTSGLGLGGMAKYTIYEGKVLDIAIYGAYSSVNPGDKDVDIALGTTKLGFFFLFK